VPSQFEPGGLITMYSLRYGAIPIAHASGGIHEIIQDYDPTLDPEQAGYGFLCYNYSPDAFWDSIKRAGFLFADQTLWGGLIRRAMEREFSWSVSAERYEDLYRGVVGESELAA
jgi:starch synthase